MIKMKLEITKQFKISSWRTSKSILFKKIRHFMGSILKKFIFVLTIIQRLSFINTFKNIYEKNIQTKYLLIF